ncbi:MAG: sugar ABC transporter permease [Defluviitaleaceae bacterium]|nr:sugar ABC transporter permease [Defluviitaleaceae bacterium]
MSYSEKKRSLKNLKYLLLFTFPALAFYFVFLFIPITSAIYYSFTDWSPVRPDYSFVGLNNYIEIFTRDRHFTNALRLTMRFTIFIFVLQNIIALGLALLVETRTKSKSFFRTIFFLPNMFSLIISSLMFRFIYTRVFVEVSELPFLGFFDQSWLGDPQVAFWSILIVSLWNGAGYMMIIYMAALQSVPASITEAAKIDGANGFRRLTKITLPMIMHAITICSFLTLIRGFQIFDVVFRLTGGGPGRATQVVALNIFEEAFQQPLRYGYANAKAMIFFAVILLITLIQTGVMKKMEIES